ncbi:MAG: 5-(carboxyamino)imidazole ribonucleotide synthase, partial [Betaproteobacteria bacterium]|nr:5-(carboxyamino)imidazole ribonucleotide synthase [Betaproteobacteria bacterium]
MDVNHNPIKIITIGVMGGGQLGRMLAHAAQRLGMRVVVLDPQLECPAAQA